LIFFFKKNFFSPDYTKTRFAVSLLEFRERKKKDRKEREREREREREKERKMQNIVGNK
jgi:tmRNA-binding protein